MQKTTEFTGEYGRRVIRREWYNTDDQLHRTTGPASEDWTVLPGGAHVLSFQGWYLDGKYHREGRPAYRWWHVANDGTRLLVVEGWGRHGESHRVGGPAYRDWTVGPDGTQTLCGHWRVNDKLHRVDGPADTKHFFCWHGGRVRGEDLSWLRRGYGFLAGFTGTMEQGGGGCSGVVSPAWSRDARVTVTGAEVAAKVGAWTYHSVVGGAVLLCV